MQTLWSVFRMFDTDNSGAISKDELRMVLADETVSGMAASEGKTEQELEQIFQDIDADGNGEISFDEFSAMMLQSDKLASHGTVGHSSSQLPGSPQATNHNCDNTFV